MIELFHIWKQYQKPYWALSDVTLQINDGDFYFITGPSGSGKSTLLKTIFRETLPTEGQILINGVNILKIHDNRIYTLRRTMGIVFQDFRLMFHRTVFENVAVPLQVIGRRAQGDPPPRLRHAPEGQPPPEDVGAPRRACPTASSSAWPSPGPSSTTPRSSWPTSRPATSTPSWPSRSSRLFKEINKQGATVIIGSHDRELIRHFGDNILFLQKGKIVGKEAHA